MMGYDKNIELLSDQFNKILTVTNKHDEIIDRVVKNSMIDQIQRSINDS
jgi:hypothetical protein